MFSFQFSVYITQYLHVQTLLRLRPIARSREVYEFLSQDSEDYGPDSTEASAPKEISRIAKNAGSRFSRALNKATSSVTSSVSQVTQSVSSASRRTNMLNSNWIPKMSSLNAIPSLSASQPIVHTPVPRQPDPDTIEVYEVRALLESGQVSILSEIWLYPMYRSVHPPHFYYTILYRQDQRIYCRIVGFLCLCIYLYLYLY